MNKFVIFCIILGLTMSKKFRNDLFEDSVMDNTQTTHWFDQLLDHYDPTNTQTFKQRYHVYDNSVPQAGSPQMVVLYICGEWTCDGIGAGQMPFTIAERYQGIILVLEHRYFGQSQPFPDWSTPNLKYLAIQQALDDLAYFIQQVKAKQLHGIPQDIPWIHMGGSYPGALTAWFRYKYPHLTVGGLASSAVVRAVADYYQYDMQVYLSSQRSGQNCVDSIQEVNGLIEDKLQNDRDNLLKDFKAESLTNIEFLSMVADVYAGMVQSRARTTLCAELDKPTLQEKYDAVVQMAALVVNEESYGSDFLKKIEIDFASNSRQWTYQTCVEVGYFQTANKDATKQTRSSSLQIDFFRNLCKESYGVDIFPDEERTNAYFGGLDINVDNLIFSNGSDDPWQHASITVQDDTKDYIVKFIECDDCSHCVDLKAEKATDPQALLDARQEILEILDGWLGMNKYIK